MLHSKSKVFEQIYQLLSRHPTMLLELSAFVLTGFAPFRGAKPMRPLLPWGGLIVNILSRFPSPADNDDKHPP